MSDHHPAIPPDHRLRDCPAHTVSISWPTPIDHRLDELVAIAREVGRDTTRREMLAAVVFATDHSPDTVDRILKNYRSATARDALVKPEAVEDGNVINLRRHRPGPR